MIYFLIFINCTKRARSHPSVAKNHKIRAIAGQNKMQLIALGKELEFISVELVLHRTGITDLFALKNNKTLAETLTSRKYFQLASQVHQRYPESIRKKLGEFVHRLKLSNDIEIDLLEKALIKHLQPEWNIALKT
jgi:hypothetical protein